MLAVASIVFVYYTVWAMFLPFFPTSHPIHELFPAREWAVRIPAFILVVGLSVVGLFIGSVVMKERAKKNAKLAVKTA
ncbi:dolichol phosphate-mannose biosynthesis regulatory [Gautieria morchelliformis]|nr:dolichol phosphate-mannose biosynthesis regulatory [Gautieria morchelliformis]